jgi:hypothetical protein
VACHGFVYACWPGMILFKKQNIIRGAAAPVAFGVLDAILQGAFGDKREVASLFFCPMCLHFAAKNFN